MRFTNGELAIFLLMVFLAGIFAGYTLGLAQQASWHAEQQETAQRFAEAEE